MFCNCCCKKRKKAKEKLKKENCKSIDEICNFVNLEKQKYTSFSSLNEAFLQFDKFINQLF